MSLPSANRSWLLSLLLVPTLGACTSGTPPAPTKTSPTTLGTLPSSITPTAIAAGGGCTAPTGSGTTHDSDVTTDETWTAAGSPHFVTSSFRITATVTIEACAVVVLSPSATLTIGDSGASAPGTLRALGELLDLTPADPNDDRYETRPVVFKSTSADSADNWDGLRVDTNGTLDLEVAVLVNGANVTSTQNGGGAIVAFGTNDGQVTKNVRAQLVFVLDATGYGVNLLSGSAFTDDSNLLVVQGAGSAAAPYPVHFALPGVGTLPAGLYTGNTRDAIEIDPRIPVVVDEAFRNRGVPYIVSGAIDLHGANVGDTATLTVEAGVTLDLDSPIFVGDAGGTAYEKLGRLVAMGTATAPIVFTSNKSTPAAGDWGGLYFDAVAPTGNALAYAVIEYAGADSQTNSYGCGAKDNDAAVIFTGRRPEAAFITNTTFRHNAGESTVVSGWVSDLSGPDFVTTNTFTDTPGAGKPSCLQTLWQAATGSSCPTTGTPPYCAPY